MRLDDQQIIEGLRSRNELVTQYVYDEFFSLCHFIVTTNGGNLQDTEDIFQETLIVLIKAIKIDGFRLTSKFQTFIYAIMDKLWKVQLLKRKRAGNYSMNYNPQSLQEFIEEYDIKLSSSKLFHCFNKLEKLCQTILKLWWSGHSQKEIAEFTSYTYGFLRKKKTRCDDYLICLIKEDSDLMKIFKEDPTLVSYANVI